MTGEVKKELLNILVDSGMTHNFLDLHKAKRLGYTTEQITPVSVVIANGEKCAKNSPGRCKGTRFMQMFFF